MHMIAASILPSLRRMATAPLVRGASVLLALMFALSWPAAGMADTAPCAGHSVQHPDASGQGGHAALHDGSEAPASAGTHDLSSGSGHCCDAPACVCMIGGVAALPLAWPGELLHLGQPRRAQVHAAVVPPSVQPRPLRPPIV